MRTGGAGLVHESGSFAPSHATAQRGPALSIGARGCSITRGRPSGTTMPCAAASNASAVLANIAGAVDVDDAAGRRCRSFARQPADHFGDFMGGGDAAQRDVGDDLRAAAPLKILGGHFRDGEAGRYAEVQYTFAGIAARDRLGHS